MAERHRKHRLIYVVANRHRFLADLDKGPRHHRLLFQQGHLLRQGRRGLRPQHLKLFLGFLFLFYIKRLLSEPENEFIPELY